MTIKSILVPLSDARTGKNALKAAVGLAKTFDAHVTALHVRPDPRAIAVDYVGEAVSGAMVEEMMKTADERAAADQKSARKLFDAGIAAGGLAMAERGTGAKGASASWLQETGYEDRWLQIHGRFADIVVVGRALTDADLAAKLSLETALIETGRPILIAPPKLPAKIGVNIAIAWKAGAEAARAIEAAKAFFPTAKKVTILTAKEGDNDQRPDELADYLAWHGIKATVTKLRASENVGASLLAAAAKAGADMMVMGAYSHSRMREMIFGGVTKHVIAKTNLPVLMAH
ncbi:MAG TPA: universal stress protein [Alphaproteobacteria bacterium]|nr:universal stress protein [Alphaproteobacteria bacterium]